MLTSFHVEYLRLVFIHLEVPPDPVFGPGSPDPSKHHLRRWQQDVIPGCMMMSDEE